jgi:hypothetical protein
MIDPARAHPLAVGAARELDSDDVSPRWETLVVSSSRRAVSCPMGQPGRFVALNSISTDAGSVELCARVAVIHDAEADQSQADTDVLSAEIGPLHRRRRPRLRMTQLGACARCATTPSIPREPG